MPRPVILGVVGDSAAGKTTITRGLMRVLGEEHVTRVCTDDYHRYDRKQRADLGITPLHPDCNYVDITAQHFAHLRRGEPVLKPVYQHSDGTFGPPVYVKPERFTIIEGLLGYHTPTMRDIYDVRVYLAPPEELRRRWKVARDCTRRGYTTDQVLSELDAREPDSESFIRPQRRFADLVVSFQPADDDADPTRLAAEITLRPGLVHPDLSAFVSDSSGITLTDVRGAHVVRIPGDVNPDEVSRIEEAVWSRMRFAAHLRERELGEVVVGNDVYRSGSLVITQLLILYHMLLTKARVALGSEEQEELEPIGA
jgi:phosphoribulokinase